MSLIQRRLDEQLRRGMWWELSYSVDGRYLQFLSIEQSTFIANVFEASTLAHLATEHPIRLSEPHATFNWSPVGHHYAHLEEGDGYIDTLVISDPVVGDLQRFKLAHIAGKYFPRPVPQWSLRGLLVR